ncbi:MAG: GAF domain-containing sensor histidine kinase [Fibrobacteria bacterium]|nr:GAF domain-containing sensor histidine kinase [Fibrobacteria bacterium]
MEIGKINITSENAGNRTRHSVLNLCEWLNLDVVEQIEVVAAVTKLWETGFYFCDNRCLSFHVIRKKLRTGLKILIELKKRHPTKQDTDKDSISGIKNNFDNGVKVIKDYILQTNNTELVENRNQIGLVKWLEKKDALPKDLIERVRKDFLLLSTCSEADAVKLQMTEMVKLGRELTERNRQSEKLLKELSSLKTSGKIKLSELRKRMNEEMNLRLLSEGTLAKRQRALESIYNISSLQNISLQKSCDKIAKSIAGIIEVPFVSLSIEKEIFPTVFSQYRDGAITHDKWLSLATLPSPLLDSKEIVYQYAGKPEKKVNLPPLLSDLKFRTLLCFTIYTADEKAVGTIYILDGKKRVFDEFDIYLLETFAQHLANQVTRIKMRKELLQSREMEVLGKLTSGVAHEVRNPLNAIQAVSQALFRKIGINEELQPFVDHINIQVKRLSNLMQDLLDLGKPLREEALLETCPVQLAESCITLWMKSTNYKEHQIEKDFQPKSHETTVKVDPVRMQQVFINLFENACNHSPVNSSIRLTITQSNPDTIAFTISDQGCGMEPEKLTRFFEPFFSMRKEGTGLGTSIVKRIVQRHYGHIKVYNNIAGPGLSVEFCLPCHQLSADE